MNSFRADKPPVLPPIYPSDSEDDEDARLRQRTEQLQRKWRWKVRRLAYGGTGCSSSCVESCTPYFVKLCRQRGLRMTDVLRYLRSAGV